MAKSTNGQTKVRPPKFDRNDPFTRWFGEMVANVSTARHEFFSRLLDPRRNINDEAGYPKTGALVVQDYRDMYDRDPVAARANDVLPDESWMVTPQVFETERPDQQTDFEKAWADLAFQLKEVDGEENFFRGEEGNPIWEDLHRVDRLSGIGHFGIILLGLENGGNLANPPTKAEKRLLFIRTLDETLVDIAQFEKNRNSPRFGKPLLYNVQLGTNEPKQAAGGVRKTSMPDTIPGDTVKVHWKRVIHVADNMVSSRVFGIPRMRQVYNRLYDLQKLYAGSAEMYWRGAFPGLSIETNPRLGTEVQIDKDAMRDMMENYMNGLQRYLALTGMQAKSLAPQVVDPTSQIEVQIDAIAIKLGIPKRIFKGSERGELASGQDDSMFNDRLRRRQNGHITPQIIVPFINRLINLGVLPKPEGFSVQWPDLDSLTDDERAQVAERRSRTLLNYVTGGGSSVMAPVDFLTRELGFTKGEAEAILSNQEEFMRQSDDSGLAATIPSKTEPEAPKQTDTLSRNE